MSKVVYTFELGVLNIPTPVRMTTCPHRLQLQTSRAQGILTEKMAFWRDECLSKVGFTMELGVLIIPTAVRMITCHHSP